MKTTLLMVCGHQRPGRFSLRRHRRNRQGREGMFLVSCARTSKSDVRRLPCFLQGMDAEADIRVGEGSFGATLWSRLAENTFRPSSSAPYRPFRRSSCGYPHRFVPYPRSAGPVPSCWVTPGEIRSGASWRKRHGFSITISMPCRPHAALPGVRRSS